MIIIEKQPNKNISIVNFKNFILLVLISLVIYLGYNYFTFDNSFAKKEFSVKCIVIDKRVEAYNASDSRVADIRYKNVFILKNSFNNKIIKLDNISVETYYRFSKNDYVYFKLNPVDLKDEKAIGLQDENYLLGFLFIVSLIVTSLYIPIFILK